MKLLVYGAGVLGSLFAARMHEAGHDISLLARGERLAALREHGVQLAEGDSPDVRRVLVPVVEHPGGEYDLTAVFVRTQQVDVVLKSLAALEGDVLFMLNWAAGAEPLGAVIGRERVLLGFPTAGGTMDGDVVRYRPANFLTRRVAMPIGEPHGSSTPRLERIVQAFRAAGINAKAEPQMDAWLKTHAAFVVPLGQAVDAAGGPAGAGRRSRRRPRNAPPHAAPPGRHANAAGTPRVRRVADFATRAARGRATALPAEPDGRAQRARQDVGGARTGAAGRTDARL